MANKLDDVISYMKNTGTHSDYKDVTKFYGGMNFTKNTFKRNVMKGGGNEQQMTGGVDSPVSNITIRDFTVETMPNSPNVPQSAILSHPVKTNYPKPHLQNDATTRESNARPIGQNVEPVVRAMSVQHDVSVPIPHQSVAQHPQMMQQTAQTLQNSQMMQQPHQPITSNGVISYTPVNPAKYNPQAYLPLPSVHVQPYTIKAGTILYNGSLNKESGEITGNLTQTPDGSTMSFFTPNFRLAFDRIGNCSINPNKSYIHAYEVIQDITNIFIKHDFITSMSFDDIQNNICASHKYNGVGFFYPANEIENFNSQFGAIGEQRMYSEFFLCNPFSFIKHLNTQKCIGTHNIGVINE